MGKCKWCGIVVYRNKKYCEDIRCKENWTNTVRLKQKIYLPVKCTICGVQFISKTERFKRLCPICIRQNWSKFCIALPKEHGRMIRMLIKQGKTTLGKIRNYVRTILYDYIDKLQ